MDTWHTYHLAVLRKRRVQLQVQMQTRGGVTTMVMEQKG